MTCSFTRTILVFSGIFTFIVDAYPASALAAPWPEIASRDPLLREFPPCSEKVSTKFARNTLYDRSLINLVSEGIFKYDKMYISIS